ncbi:hypothetical protein BJX63DRAFT_42821 [Aspergillus granulosus]|uniref:Uncharacterized protein n=1 Tax=Aspergillus granulosus TaxID=176169 RepID=A0ABR4HTK7_9EURO
MRISIYKAQVNLTPRFLSTIHTRWGRVSTRGPIIVQHAHQTQRTAIGATLNDSPLPLESGQLLWTRSTRWEAYLADYPTSLPNFWLRLQVSHSPREHTLTLTLSDTCSLPASLHDPFCDAPAEFWSSSDPASSLPSANAAPHSGPVYSWNELPHSLPRFRSTPRAFPTS